MRSALRYLLGAHVFDWSAFCQPDGKLFFVAPSTRAYMALTSLNQDLLRVDSSISREIKVRTYDLRSSAPPCAEYSSRGTPIGVAILQDQEGVVNYFALSDGASVTAVSLSNHQFSKSRVECPKVLTTLLASGACAAFDMSRVALHIWATVDAHVRGHDLSRIGSPDQLTPQLPSKVVSTRIHHLRDTYSVDSLWNNVCGPSDYLASQSRFESMCLRAWLSARSLSSYHIQANPLTPPQSCFELYRPDTKCEVTGHPDHQK